MKEINGDLGRRGKQENGGYIKVIEKNNKEKKEEVIWQVGSQDNNSSWEHMNEAGKGFREQKGMFFLWNRHLAQRVNLPYSKTV